jgi:hypothetical protein
MGFDPYNRSFENSGVYWDSNSQSGSSLGSVRVHSLTLSYTPGSMTCDYGASYLAHTFASPCLGCEPKAWDVTFRVQLQSNEQKKVLKYKKNSKLDKYLCFSI